VNTNQPTLADWATSINKLFGNVDKTDKAARHARISVGEELIAARELVDAEGLGWNAWCKANIKRSRQDIARVMKIAAAEDPEAALEAAHAAKRVSKPEDVTPGYIEPDAEASAPTAATVPGDPTAVLSTAGVWGAPPAPVDVTPAETQEPVTIAPPIDTRLKLDVLCDAWADADFDDREQFKERFGLMEPCRQILEREHPELFARVRSKELSVKEAVKEVAAMMKATPADPDEEAGGFAPGVLDAIKADQADEQTEEELQACQDRQLATVKAAAYTFAKRAKKGAAFGTMTAKEKQRFFDLAIAEDAKAAA
jgi:hypothetical protein